MLRVNQLIGFGASTAVAQASSYSANAVRFAPNDEADRAGGLTGAADGKEFTCSFWMNMKGGDSSADYVLSAGDTGNQAINIIRTASNTIQFDMYTSGASRVCNLISSTTMQIADGWFHILCSVNALTSTGYLYINDSSDAATNTVNNLTIDFTHTGGAPGDDWTFGNLYNGGTQNIDADFADFWFALSFFDLSTESNRRKFISAAGKPVDLGSDGSNPGASPIIFFSKQGSDGNDDWVSNKGTGGGFTLSGSLAAGASSPSD